MIFVVLAEICRCRAEIFVVPEDIGNMPRLLLVLRELYRKYAKIFVDMLILLNVAILMIQVNLVILVNLAKLVILVNLMIFLNFIILVVQLNLMILVNLVILVNLEILDLKARIVVSLDVGALIL